jgi:hypothetical protein
MGMTTIVFICWIVSLVLLAIAAWFPARTYNLVAAGLFFFDLWVGLQTLVEGGDRITL